MHGDHQYVSLTRDPAICLFISTCERPRSLKPFSALCKKCTLRAEVARAFAQPNSGKYVVFPHLLK